MFFLLLAGCSGTPAAPSGGPGPSAAPDTRPAATDVEREPVGKLRLEGQVIDADHLPVAGARVTISTVPPRDVVTGDDGSFAFDRLVARTYQLWATTESRRTLLVTHSLTATSAPVVLRVRRKKANDRIERGYGDVCDRKSDCPGDAGCHDGVCVQYPE